MREGTWSASAIFDAIKIIILHSEAKSYSEDIGDVTSTVTQYLGLAKSDQNKRSD